MLGFPCSTVSVILVIRARGNFTVDLYWKDNNLTKVVVYSGSGVPCSIYYKGEKLEFQTNAGCSYCIENDNRRLTLK
ncbi:glycoside hydrolase family 95-like protein [Phocaeicola barnesiae]